MSCSEASAAVGEPLAGSAATALAWFALEQPGPWGPRALTDSHLDPSVGAALDAAATPIGVRVCLIRRPGQHVDRGEGHEFLAASTHPDRSWLVAGRVEDPATLVGLDWSALGSGDRVAFTAGLDRIGVSWQHAPDPVLLVCTNGRRDTCCATVGRPVALAAAAAYPGSVWEVTHTGGHRFAPTAVTLPDGYLYGRLDTATVLGVVEAARAGQVEVDLARGRSAWLPAGQVAELAVRRATGETSSDALSVLAVTGDLVQVVHRDGRTWDVVIGEQDVPDRPESCRKPAVTGRALVAVSLSPR